jgi:hypothetical protein
MIRQQHFVHDLLLRFVVACLQLQMIWMCLQGLLLCLLKSHWVQGLVKQGLVKQGVVVDLMLHAFSVSLLVVRSVNHQENLNSQVRGVGWMLPVSAYPSSFLLIQ